MIIVTATLISAHGQQFDRELGRAIICNDGTGSDTYGNYSAQFYGQSGGLGKSGKVDNYPRKAVAIWNLVRRACEAAGYTK